MTTTGIHHLYIETHDWDASLEFWAALGFELSQGWGEGRDGILANGDGPYVFLREVPRSAELAFDVVLGADDMTQVGESGVRVTREPYDTGWGPRFIDVEDADGRRYAIREESRRDD